MPYRVNSPETLKLYKPNEVVNTSGGIYLKPGVQPRGGVSNQSSVPQAPQQQAAPQSYKDFIDAAFSNPQLDSAQKQYEESQKQLSDLSAQLPNYALNKQKEIMSNDPALAQLQSERAKYVGNLYSAPQTARDQYSGIFDPTRRDALVSQAVGNVLGQLSGTNALISQRQGTASNTANQALELLKAQIGTVETGLTNRKSTVDTLQTLLKDIAEKGYAAKTKAQDRVQNLQDQKDLARYKSGLKTPGSATPVSQLRTNVYRAVGSNKDSSVKYQQVGYSIYNPKTTKTAYTDLSGQPLSLTPEDRVSAITSGFGQQSDVTTDNNDLNPLYNQ